MLVRDLEFTYPPHLVAIEPEYPPRVMFAAKDKNPQEISWQDLSSFFSSGDILVINETRVVPRRVFAKTDRLEEFEILFVERTEPLPTIGLEPSAEIWNVLCPATRLKDNEVVLLPGGIEGCLLSRGRVQTLKCSASLAPEYFETHGDVPLPPYIQKARGQRRPQWEDRTWYQTHWAKNAGSSAAPTASLHFQEQDLAALAAKGVGIHKLTLHVGLGTYLPVVVKDLKEHSMHAESVQIPISTWRAIQKALRDEKRVWALGTTSLRALESAALGHLQETPEGFSGQTSLLIYPGYEFKVVSGLLTNFHQPQSTLLALVSGFAGYQKTMEAYHWAIQNNFRLFSYGDLSVWTR